MSVNIAFAIPLSKSNLYVNSEAYTISQFRCINVFLTSSTSQQFGSSSVGYYFGSYLSLLFLHVIHVLY